MYFLLNTGIFQCHVQFSGVYDGVCFIEMGGNNLNTNYIVIFKAFASRNCGQKRPSETIH